MRKWEDIVKDKMEEFDETLPESVFVEFHAMRNGAAPDPAPKRFPLVWALVPAVAAGMAAVLLLRHPSTLDNGIQIIHQPVQPVAAVTDSVEVVETIQDQPLIAQAPTLSFHFFFLPPGRREACGRTTTLRSGFGPSEPTSFGHSKMIQPLFGPNTSNILCNSVNCQERFGYFHRSL